MIRRNCIIALHLILSQFTSLSCKVHLHYIYTGIAFHVAKLNLINLKAYLYMKYVAASYLRDRHKRKYSIIMSDFYNIWIGLAFLFLSKLITSAFDRFK